ncbi:hypothetical protein EDB87DRAFT_1642317, partial [Lactarius vividus]
MIDDVSMLDVFLLSLSCFFFFFFQSLSLCCLCSVIPAVPLFCSDLSLFFFSVHLAVVRIYIPAFLLYSTYICIDHKNSIIFTL